MAGDEANWKLKIPNPPATAGGNDLIGLSRDTLRSLADRRNLYDSPDPTATFASTDSPSREQPAGSIQPADKRSSGPP